MLFANVAIILTDLDGLRMTFDWGGASAHKPCICCANVWKKDIPLLPGNVNIHCTDTTLFKLRDHSDMIGIMAVLIESKSKYLNGEMGAGEYKELVQGLGFNANPWSLQADPALCEVLDLPAVIRTDWVHIFLSHGTFAKECTVFVQACADIGLAFNFWRDLLKADWRFPKRRGVKTSELHNAFSSHNEDNQTVICKASEYLSLYVIMRHFIESRLMDDDRVKPQRESFEALCKVLDLILLAKRSDTDNAPRVAEPLQMALVAHSRLHQRAYGTTHVLPKHHASFHNAGQILRDKCVIDMFVVERLNIRVKQVAEAVKNTESWETSVSASLWTRQFNQLAEGSLNISNGSLGASVPFPGHPATSLSKAVRQDGKEFHTGDIVVAGAYVGKILGCATEGHQLALILQMMDLVGHRTRSSGRYVLSQRLRTVLVHDAWESNAWYHHGGDEYTVLH